MSIPAMPFLFLVQFTSVRSRLILSYTDQFLTKNPLETTAAHEMNLLKIEHLLSLNIENGELPHMGESKLLLSPIK